MHGTSIKVETCIY